MRAAFAESDKMPTLNSVYLSGFSQETLELLRASRPFAAYNARTKEYEVTPDVYSKLKEPTTVFTDLRKNYPRYERKRTEERYGYQLDAVDFARQVANVFLNFSQGMGKSYTTMQILQDKGISKTLVICGQGNLQEEWLKDIEKHNMRSLNAAIIGEDTAAGNAKKLKWLSKAGEKSLDLINIEALRNESIVAALNARKYECVVVDEVQAAKGWKAEQTEGLHDLVRHPGQMRIALSGTPVLNNPLEFFSLLKFFGMLRNTARTTFEKYYGVWGFDFWGHYVCKGYKNMQSMQELISPIICYAEKSELSLPPKERTKVDLDWNCPERFCYLKRMYAASDKQIKSAGFKSKPQIRAEMIHLSSTADVKFEFVRDHAMRSKVLVFSMYTSALAECEVYLEKAGLKVLYYHGELSMAERLNVLAQWRTGQYDVLLLSLMTARYGLNLTEATEAVFLEPPTSLAVLEQAEDRSHRIGQTRQVNSYLLCASDIDVNGLTAIQEKQRSIDELYGSLR